MAGEGRQALLDIIDEAAGMEDLHRKLGEAKQIYFEKKTRLRGLRAKLAVQTDKERQLRDLARKLAAFSQSGHADVLKAHQQARRQRRAVDDTLEQLKDIPGHIESLFDHFILDDWPDDTFSPEQDQNALAWRSEVKNMLQETKESLMGISAKLKKELVALRAHDQLAKWHDHTREAQAKYDTLRTNLSKQGVADPSEYDRIVQEYQDIEVELKELDRMQSDYVGLEAEIEDQLTRVLDCRKAITEKRRVFVENTLKDNEFVRIEVVGFGFDPSNIEGDLRRLLECEDDRFANDIDTLVSDIAEAEESHRENKLEAAKQHLVNLDDEFGGRFRKYLASKMDKPEFVDHVLCWFPEDDLRIEYNRNREWSRIEQASQGQRSAALLAFLLAFGDEPLILD